MGGAQFTPRYSSIDYSRTANLWLIVICGMSMLSPFWIGRITTGGFAIHVYLLAATAIWGFSVTNWRIPANGRQHLFSALAFALMLLAVPVALNFNPQGLAFLVKLAAGFFTIYIVARLVISRQNFITASIVLVLGAAVVGGLGIFAYLESESHVSDVIETANKNALSLYTLPPLMLGLILLRTHAIAGKWKLLVIGSCIAICLVILSSWNRSGWVGVAVVFALVFAKGMKHRNWSRILIAAVVGMAIYLMFAIGTINLFLERSEETNERNIRIDLVYTGAEIFSEHPIFGVGPQNIAHENYRRLVARHPQLEQYKAVATHNIQTEILAGFGLTGIFTVLYLCSAIYTTKRKYLKNLTSPDDKLLASALPMVFILWMIRGAFTHEIWFSPTFNIALGLAIGIRLHLAQKVEQQHQMLKWEHQRRWRANPQQ